MDSTHIHGHFEGEECLVHLCNTVKVDALFRCVLQCGAVLCACIVIGAGCGAILL